LIGRSLAGVTIRLAIGGSIDGLRVPLGRELPEDHCRAIGNGLLRNYRASRLHVNQLGHSTQAPAIRSLRLRLRSHGPCARAVPFDSLRPLAFMHVPKTCGTAVTHGLVEALAPTVVLGGFDLSLFGAGYDFSTVDERIRSQIYVSPASMPKHADLIAGHLAHSTLSAAYPLAQRITLLREPITRLMSHWLYWRHLTDQNLTPLGKWGDLVRRARTPLANFLDENLLAVQIDNLVVRMLLWPHPLIEATQFIDPRHDSRLVREAMARLDDFDFVDIVEDDAFVEPLQRWLGRSFSYKRLNETPPIPETFRTPLQRELTPLAHERLYTRSRLDLVVWRNVAARRLVAQDVSRLRERTILANVARYALLMAC
jgi:hypothetical protein